MARTKVRVVRAGAAAPGRRGAAVLPERAGLAEAAPGQVAPGASAGGPAAVERVVPAASPGRAAVVVAALRSVP
ncbi:hypothetical protein [Vulgatibacter sp.]|uniref:hypothetical protein n=1 Tax=Vulgatibacter sp. TaxID=1971226 RepID=UPI00356739C0